MISEMFSNTVYSTFDDARNDVYPHRTPIPGSVSPILSLNQSGRKFNQVDLFPIPKLSRLTPSSEIIPGAGLGV